MFIFIASIFVVIKFGYFNISFAEPVSLQQYQTQIISSSFIQSSSLKLHPIEKSEYKQYKCPQDECTVFYATKFNVKTSSEYLPYINMPKYTPDKVLVKGMSFKIIDVIKNYKYFQISGSKSISLFKPKVE